VRASDLVRCSNAPAGAASLGAAALTVAAGLVICQEAVVRRLLLATKNSWNGLLAAARSEQAVRQELVAFVIAVPLAFLVGSGTWQRVALIAVVLLVLVAELLNTAVEKLSDHVTPSTHPAIGRIKDMGSASVGFALLLAGLVWLAALAERLGLF
jgi:diacylglycerol kinase (ATP)